MDTKFIATSAKEKLLAGGECRPTLYVELKKSEHMLVFPLKNLPRYLYDQRKFLFFLGRSIGQKYFHEEIAMAVFLAEAWYVISGEERIQEALFLFSLDVQEKKVTEKLFKYEILRFGDIVDLASEPFELKIKDHLMTFLFAGFLSRKHSEQEMSEVAQRITTSQTEFEDYW